MGMGASAWPSADSTRVPYWVYTDPALYREELERIFYGPVWCYVGLTTEVTQPGDFRRSTLGEVPVVLTRDRRDEVHVLVNRCAHRGVQLCHEAAGNATQLTCPY